MTMHIVGFLIGLPIGFALVRIAFYVRDRHRAATYKPMLGPHQQSHYMSRPIIVEELTDGKH